ncbi:choice-of-anchor P family protein [Micromonospora sp. WMMD1102]|uniref:choice-of-anchor P family protein n=1 Tax=Micromonospora sp. WMMD1102 TaxID=3016105 RepID=UPI0024157274|nr:choice-of-anchor P family protein [Micromonospora sp. WMMD1102]MDG4786353.1 choice-of-anchor P family protein [Micromonospora sp. WMMD1102]
MSKKRLSLGKLALATVAGCTAAVLAASPALADTSQVSASALQITLLGGTVASSGTFTASNTDGGSETTSGDPDPLLSVLGGQTVITAGVLGQYGRALFGGVSRGCAGVVGTGGAFVVGADGTCVVDNGAEVDFVLGTVGLATISLTADAIYATCEATSTPTASGAASLVNARITSTVLGIETTLLSLPANPPPNTGLTVPGLVNLLLNAQTSSGPGQIDVTALQLEALSGTLVSLEVGNVICGPNAIAPPIPVIPLAGAPIAAGALGLVAVGGLLRYRNRRGVGVRS